MFDTQTRLDDAVSPVVGVILMVAVTVILAAVIGSFVLDLGNNVQANPQAGVTFDQAPEGTTDANGNEEYEVSVQVVSMENADEVGISAANTDGSPSAPTVGTTPLTSVGESSSVTGLTADDKITVTGTLDGKEAVLQTYTVQG